MCAAAISEEGEAKSDSSMSARSAMAQEPEVVTCTSRPWRAKISLASGSAKSDSFSEPMMPRTVVSSCCWTVGASSVGGSAEPSACGPSAMAPATTTAARMRTTPATNVLALEPT